MFLDFLPLLIPATLMTLGLAFASLILGMILSLVFLVLETSRIKCIANTTSIYLTLMRGLPEILIIFLIYFGSSQVIFLITGDYIEFSAFWCGTWALSLIFASYASQSLRGAVKAIAKGQWESGSAIGLTNAQTFIQIIMPQVWRHALPGLSNQWMALLKDTALISLIGVDEIMRQTDLSNANTHQPFAWYATAFLIYLAITLVSKVVIKRMELRFTTFERSAA